MTERIQCKKGASCIGPHLTIKTEYVCLFWTHPAFAPCIHLCYNGKHVVHQTVNSKALLIWLVYLPSGDIGETFKYWFCTSTSSTVTNTYSIYSHILDLNTSEFCVSLQLKLEYIHQNWLTRGQLFCRYMHWQPPRLWQFMLGEALSLHILHIRLLVIRKLKQTNGR